MALPSITPLPSPPLRSMSADAFAAAAEAWMAALSTYQAEINALSTALTAALGWTTLGTLTTTSGTTQDLTGISQSYNDLLVLINGVSFTGAVNMTMAIGNATPSYATGQAVATGAAGGTDTLYGAIFLPGYTQGEGTYYGGATPLSADLTSGALTFLGRNWRLSGGVRALRFAGGTFDAGSIILKGRQ